MPKCEQCKKSIPMLKFIFRSDWLCDACAAKKEKKNDKVESAKSLLQEGGIAFNFWTSDNAVPYSAFPPDEYRGLFLKKDIGYWKLTQEEYDSLVSAVLKKNLNAEPVIRTFWESLAKKKEKEKILLRQKRLAVRHDAEKEFFGQVKTRRVPISEDEKQAIFERFNHQCAICSAQEGLHIHHKDHNPSNNTVANLLVLCGLCHKKIHMKVR